MTAVSGTWKQPTVTANGATTAYSSVWVGIDGYSSSIPSNRSARTPTSSTASRRIMRGTRCIPRMR